MLSSRSVKNVGVNEMNGCARFIHDASQDREVLSNPPSPADSMSMSTASCGKLVAAAWSSSAWKFVGESAVAP